MKHVSIKDIARELGIAHSTVSRALNDKYDISKATREKVLKKAEEMGYHPNPMGKKLQQSKSYNIGIVIPEFRNAFFPDVILGIQEVLLEKGYQVLIMQSNENADTELQIVQNLYDNMVDGIIISFTEKTKSVKFVNSIAKAGFPIIQFNRVMDSIKTSKVVFDDYTWAMLCTEHLINQGYKRILHFASSQKISLCKLREKGFVDALKKHNITLDKEQIIESGLSIEDGMASMEKVLKSGIKFDAVFGVTDTTTIGAMMVLKKHQINIPNDVGVVGFSESRLSSVIEPSLTTVKQPTFEMGQAAAKLILQEIETEIRVAQTITLGGVFKVKESSVRL